LNKKNQIYDLIVDGLVNARYAFGDKLLVKELATHTGASRQPIMAALNRLSADGFVQIIPQVGCQVIDPTREQISDFFMMFQRMEGLLAELAAARHSPDQLSALFGIQRRLLTLEQKNDGSSTGEYVTLNRDFHHLMHVMARSPLLDERQRNNFNMCDFFITHSSGFGAFMSDAVREHEYIIEAIANRQPERARDVAEAHIAAIATAVLAGLTDR
jgi:DNA-binding GntR family transcriptional regulator